MNKIIPYLDPRLQEPELRITIKPLLAKKVRSIGRKKGLDPEAWVLLQIARGMNEYWDFREGKPKE